MAQNNADAGAASGGAGNAGAGQSTQTASPGADAGSSAGVQHGPGSFTNNNAADLPGQETKNQSPDKAPDVNAPFQEARPAEANTQELENKRSFKPNRKPIAAPRDELAMETDLPHKEAVDRETHHQKLSKEDFLAKRTQPNEAKQKMRADHEKKIEAGQKPNIHTRESFIRARFEKIKDPKHGKGRSQ